MLSCKDVSELASQQLDHKLTLTKRFQFRMHLMMCHHCRLFMQQIQLTISVLSRIKPAQTTTSNIENRVKSLLVLAKKNHEQ